eukprot:5572605-Pleurochrysis_carterae.AAC.1
MGVDYLFIIADAVVDIYGSIDVFATSLLQLLKSDEDRGDGDVSGVLCMLALVLWPDHFEVWIGEDDIPVLQRLATSEALGRGPAVYRVYPKHGCAWLDCPDTVREQARLVLRLYHRKIRGIRLNMIRGIRLNMVREKEDGWPCISAILAVPSTSQTS